MSETACRICGSATSPAGIKRGQFQARDFELRHCQACRFSFVANPWLDYERIYSEEYYRGEGADPLVDYLFELEHPEQTIRAYEWRGILQAVSSLVSQGATGARWGRRIRLPTRRRRAARPAQAKTPAPPVETQWLDFGCGNGGLVRYLRDRGIQAVGFEEGWIAGRARAAGIPILSTHELRPEAFDIITAIEVLEHIQDPLETLRRIHSLLKPGGLFFFTTGNAEPARGHLAEWRYVVPEIHISFFEPSTARLALEKAGFETRFPGFLPGFVDIIRFKALKNLGVERRSWWQSCLPWSWLARLLDSRLRITAHPVGWAKGIE